MLYYRYHVKTSSITQFSLCLWIIWKIYFSCIEWKLFKPEMQPEMLNSVVHAEKVNRTFRPAVFGNNVSLFLWRRHGGSVGCITPSSRAHWLIVCCGAWPSTRAQGPFSTRIQCQEEFLNARSTYNPVKLLASLC